MGAAQRGCIQVKILAGLCLLVCLSGWAVAQDEGELIAKKRLFPGVGPGLRAVKRGADGNFYILSAPGSTVTVFDPAGKLLRRVPEYDESKAPAAASAQLTSIVF